MPVKACATTGRSKRYHPPVPMHSLKSLLQQVVRRHGAERPAAPADDTALMRQALEAVRPDLLLFLTRVTRERNILVLEFRHAAAAQEAQLESRRILASVQTIAGAKVASGVRCKSGAG